MSKSIDVQKILNLYAKHISVNNIVRDTGYSRTTILKHLKQKGAWEDRGPNIDVDQIIDRYQNKNQSVQTISSEMKISRTTVVKYLTLNNIEIRDNTKKVDAAQVIKLYKDGLLIKDIVKIVGFSEDTIRKHLKKNKIPINNHTVLGTVNHKDVIKFYKSTKNLVKTALKFDVGVGSIKKILIKNNIPFGPARWDRKNDSEIIKLYKDGLSAYEIGDKFGFCHTTILKNLKRLGINKDDKKPTNMSKSLFSRIKTNANIRKLDFDITSKYIYELFLKQNEKCALSGLEITLPKCNADIQFGQFTASLDRIDSSKGYTEDNIQWVHKKINIMKQDMSDTQFIDFCKTIAEFNS